MTDLTGTRAIVPVPTAAPEPRLRHREYGTPTTTWEYRTATGELACVVARYDFKDKTGQPDKAVLPFSYVESADGRRSWRQKALPAPRPLYRLPALAARPATPVLVVEGEKTADAAAKRFPDYVVTTSSGGAKAAGKTDWSPLAGRTVVVWPDNDEPGRAFAADVARLALAAGATSVRIVAVPASFPSGWDLADPTPEGADLAALLAAAVPWQAPAPEPAPAEPAKKWQSPFRLGERGLERRVERPDPQGGDPVVTWVWFGSEIEVVAETRTGTGEDWGLWLRIRDRDGRDHFWRMPAAALAGSGEAVRAELFSRGFRLSTHPKARDWLAEFLATAQSDRRAFTVDRGGWHESDTGTLFVSGGWTAGAPASELVILEGPAGREPTFKTAGDLAGWRDTIGRWSAGNSRLTFAVSLSFAAPLAWRVGAEGGIYHFRGASSLGKSTALAVSASVWGAKLRTWRTTDNGLEGVAAAHTDALLVLDELGQADARSVGNVAYMLSAGVGKSRAGRDGSGRAIAEFRITAISSGEISLATKIGEDGRDRRETGGQSVRMIDLEADAGRGLGLFETLHGHQDGAAFSVALRTAATRHQGAAARAFIERLVAEPAAIERARDLAGTFVRRQLPPGADGQVERVARRFGLVGAAGELAIGWGIVPWPSGEATRAAARLFRDWLANRGGTESAEEMAGIAAVRRFIEAHGSSRFQPIGAMIPRDSQGAPIDLRIPDRVGFRRGDGKDSIDYIILPESFHFTVLMGHDSKMIARAMLARDMLVHDPKKVVSTQRLPGFAKPVKCYVVKSSIFGDPDPTPAVPAGNNPDHGSGGFVTQVTQPEPAGVTEKSQSDQACYPGYPSYPDFRSTPAETAAKFDGDVSAPETEWQA